MLVECALGLPVTSEVASSSLVVPAIFHRKPDGYEAIRFSVSAAWKPDGFLDHPMINQGRMRTIDESSTFAAGRA